MVSGEVVLLIIISLINLALWFVFFTRLKRTFSPQALLSDITNEVDKLLIEINKTALEDVTLIEERVKGLRALIDEADKRLLLLQGQEKGKKREKEVLERLSSKREVLPPVRNAAQAYKNVSKKETPSDDSESVQLSIDFDAYRIPEENIEQIIDAEIPEIIHVKNTPLAEVPFKEAVLQLAKDDFSSEYISNKLGLSVTEVQLIIDLNQS